MAFFGKSKVKNTGTLIYEEVKLATTFIIVRYNDNGVLKSKLFRWFFLVYEENEEYFDIFSNKLIKKKEDAKNGGMGSLNFGSPYIEKLEPVTEYLINPKNRSIDIQMLFDFILNMNIQERLRDSIREKN